MSNKIIHKGKKIPLPQMLSAPAGRSDVIKTLGDLPPLPCDFNRGDAVTFTNSNGVSYSGYTIIGFGEPLEHRPDHFIYLDYDCWWFPVSSDSLKLEKRHKSEAASKVLLLIDSKEDGADHYAEFVRRISESDNVSIEQLERELAPFI